LWAKKRQIKEACGCLKAGKKKKEGIWLKDECFGCFWGDKCDATGSLEYRCSITGVNEYSVREYEEALEERVEEYQEIIDEFN
jgi:hypothetical protein